MTDETANTDASGAGAVNDQIRDSVAQMQQLLDGMQRPFAAAATFNVVAHALSLALQNAVTRQQHSQMLRSALTTAAANAMLDSKLDEANAVLKLAESPLVNPSFDLEIGQLRQVISGLREELEKLHAAAASASG
jgi:hypothetical protein